MFVYAECGESVCFAYDRVIRILEESGEEELTLRFNELDVKVRWNSCEEDIVEKYYLLHKTRNLEAC